MQIDEIINEKYPKDNIVAQTERQAAKFGYSLGEDMAVEFAEWILENAYMRMGPKYWSNGKHSWVDSKQLFQLFKLKTGENGSK